MLRGFLVFAGVFEGCSRKNAFSAWCFDGENVVKCVVNVVGKPSLFRPQKMRHHSQLFFFSTRSCSQFRYDLPHCLSRFVFSVGGKADRAYAGVATTAVALADRREVHKL